MAQAFSFVILLVLCPCVYGKPLNSHTLHFGSVDGHGQVLPISNYSWADGNQSCSSLIKDCMDFLGLLPTSSSQFIKPALLLGLKKIGCVSETDELYVDLLQDEATRETFALLNKQMENSVLQRPAHQRSALKRAVEHKFIKFNLESLLPSAQPTRHQNCSGFHKKENVFLNGLDLGVHTTMQEAKAYCHHLGSGCAGISSDILGKYYSVARNGAYIMPQKGAKLWLHTCNAVYLRRRSANAECINENEQRIHNVMQWIPVAGSWYNAGTAVYYATQGCTEQAEDRALEASLDLGYDALLAATGGTVGAVGVGVGIAVKPALKAGVKAVISFLKAG